MPNQLHTLSLILTLAAQPVAAAAADTALLGMHQVSVAVEGLPKDTDRYGLTQADLKAAVEAALPAAVTVAGDARDRVVLRVNLSTAGGGYGYYSYALRLQVERPLSVQGAEGAYVPKVVWMNGSQGVLLPQELQRLKGETEKLGQGLAQALSP